MKSLKIVLTSIIFTLAGLSLNAQARFASLNSVTPAFKEKIAMTTLALAMEGYELGESYTTTIEQGETVTFTRNFHEFNEYVIVAISEGGVKDLDLELVDRYGDVLKKDNEVADGGAALINTVLVDSKRLKIKVKNYKAYNSRAYYDTVVIVAYKNL